MDKIGIIVAMEEEQNAVKNLMKDIELEEIYELDFYRGKIKDKKCVLVQSGVGKVNAARTTQILINKYKVDRIINVGSAASINPMLNIGDVLIGKHVVQHDFDITAFGHSKGYITGVGDKISCDSDFFKKFENKIKIEKEFNNKDKNKRNYNIKLGIIATGDVFCSDVSISDEISATFNADAVDMECAAIGQVCYLDNIPFNVIRGVSDTPNGKNANIFDDNLELASKRACEVLIEIFEGNKPVN